MPDDFYMIEDTAGGTGYGSGKIDVDGQTVNFHFVSYGAVFDINIDGTKYPQMFGGVGDWKYSFVGSYSKGGEDVDERTRIVPESIVTKIADKIDQICRMASEQPDTIEQIASKIGPEGSLDDSDEFEEDRFDIVFSHVKDGRKIQMPEGSKPSDFIKRLRTKQEAPEPPLPKGLYRDPHVARPREGDEDPRDDAPLF